ncbi:hypothetical protein LINGRAHAP2_LOCUS14474 [Linum grandiflorum]
MGLGNLEISFSRQLICGYISIASLRSTNRSTTSRWWPISTSSISHATEPA